MRYLLQEGRENLDALLDKYAEAKAIQDKVQVLLDGAFFVSLTAWRRLYSYLLRYPRF
ncbi:hypothetical protein [Ruegeria sp. HKCCA5929]|uniref:hypothetical protein n=1 Tax=Ruegeria sp. HKCCA5929 TaxID=2682988 RepID=UPI001C2C7A66|nr:hypothetical protein [Ruegeria sp. HKCCA5929]